VRQSLDGHSFSLCFTLCLCNSFHEYFVPHSKKNRSSHTLVFLRCPSTEEWMQKIWYIYTMEYYSAIKKKEFMKFLDKWMDLEDIILSEVTQSQKNKHGIHSLISGY
jgi:membrane-bound acyltransferase YfiQ involved in biofilm formation